MRFAACGFCRASYKRCTDCFHTFIAHTRSATSLAIMDATKETPLPATTMPLHSHSEVAYWIVCDNFVESGWLILSRNAISNKARVPAQSPFHKQLTEKRKDSRLFHLLASRKNFQSFAVICRKPHVASSICLRATIFQNSEWTLWTQCISGGST
jgi:hypothetical protein